MPVLIVPGTFNRSPRIAVWQPHAGFDRARLLAVTCVEAAILVTFFCASLAGAATPAAPRCAPLSSGENARLAAYVAARYELAPDITVEDGGTLENTCVRRLTFHSAAPPRSLDLFLSPDGRFLFESALNTTIDPAIERQRAAAETQKALLADDSPSKGPKDAPVTLVEFADFECPPCAHLADLLFAMRISKEGLRARVVFKQMPLPMHPWARPAALASICARRQSDEAFWALYDYLFANQASITVSNVDEKIATLASRDPRLHPNQLKQCLESHAADEELHRDESLARSYHITATPTVFINGTRNKEGFPRPEDLRAAIDAAASIVAKAVSGSPSAK